jgi:hypothetical protein
MSEQANTHEIQQAVADLAMIRRAIDSVQGKREAGEGTRRGLDANLIIQTLALFMAAGLCLVELAMDHVLSRGLMVTAWETEWKLFVLADVAILLLLLVMIAYFIVWRASRHSGKDFSTFVAHNVSYLRNMSLVSDLLIKFAALCLIVLANKPQWIAPLLCLFVGDYLIQGRLFSLPLRSSLLLGLACIGVGAGMFFFGAWLLLWALVLFVAVQALSVVFLLRLRSKKHGGAAAA